MTSPGPRSKSCAGRRGLRIALLLAVASLLAGCGRDAGGGGLPASIQGPPRWRVLSPESRAGGSGFALQARTPCRAQFRFVQPGATLPEDGPWHTLTAGQTAHILWELQTNAPTGSEDLPGPGDAQAGRTDAHATTMRFQIAGSLVWQRRFVWWARPGKGRLLSTECLPPGAYEPLEWGRPLEVAAVAMTDLAGGEVRLLPREPQSRLVLPEDARPGDRHEMLRVMLVIERLKRE